MYRNKMMIIATVLVSGLLGVMIWSSHVVADHHAQQNQPPAEQPENISNDNLEQEQIDDTPQQFEETPPPPQREELLPQTDTEEPLVIDTSIIEPQILERLQSKPRIEKNYLDKLTGMKRLVLWNPSTFPLKVYISDEANLPAGFADGIKTAFNNWQNSSKRFVSFDFVSNEDGADIIVKVPDAAANCAEEDGITRELVIANNTLQRAYLTVPKTDCEGKQRNVARLYSTVQHHVGHLLGINGHSSRVADVMYSETSYENINITDIDTNTLKYLYTFKPNVTNKAFTTTELKKKLRFADIKGASSEEIENYLTENLLSDKVEATPLDRAIETGLRYLDQSNYRMATTYFKNALEKADDRFDKAYIYRALAITSLRSEEDINEAFGYANEAYSRANNPANDYLVAYIQYKMNDESACLERLERIMHDYPKLKSAYSLAAQIYNNKGDTNKLKEISQRAKDNFFENPPVVYNVE